VVIWLGLVRDQLQISPRFMQMLQALILVLPLFAAPFGGLTGYSIEPLVPGAAFFVVARAVPRRRAVVKLEPRQFTS
jgi:hypothetical protein